MAILVLRAWRMDLVLHVLLLPLLERMTDSVNAQPAFGITISLYVHNVTTNVEVVQMALHALLVPHLL